MSRMSLASLVLSSLLLAVCQASPAAANGGVVSAVEIQTTAGNPAATAADNPLATELFTLVGSRVCGKDCPQYDARVDKAFTAMLADAAGLGDARLRERLLSGPQPAGQRVEMHDGDRWLYGACQAHQCSTTTLIAFYDPEDGAMKGRLLYRCQVLWLGNLSSDEMDKMSELAPVDYSDIGYNIGCSQD